MIGKPLTASALALIGLVTAAPSGAAEPPPVVVELFTSQACSSCPPADALLRELARRPDIIALGFHVTYWNGPGWRDPLSSDAATERQKAYGLRFNNGQIYTPEMVVNGADDVIGSDRPAVQAALAQARPAAVAAVTFAPDRRSVAVGKGDGRGSVLLVRFLEQRTTDVAGGENAGRRLQDANAVRSIAPLGVWDGSAATFPLVPPAAGEGIAVLVQATEGGPILGAAAIPGAE